MNQPVPCTPPAAPAQQISKTYTHYAATALFFFFGGRMLYEAVTNAHAGENELDEVEKELEVGANCHEVNISWFMVLRAGLSEATCTATDAHAGENELDEVEKEREMGPGMTVFAVILPRVGTGMLPADVSCTLSAFKQRLLLAAARQACCVLRCGACTG